jgi:hypothetical protein
MNITSYRKARIAVIQTDSEPAYKKLCKAKLWTIPYAVLQLSPEIDR